MSTENSTQPAKNLPVKYKARAIKAHSSDEWMADGTKKYRTEIIIDSFQFGPKREGSGSAPYTPPDQGSQASGAKSAPQAQPELETIQYPTEEINIDDIPF